MDGIAIHEIDKDSWTNVDSGRGSRIIGAGEWFVEIFWPSKKGDMLLDYCEMDVEQMSHEHLLNGRNLFKKHQMI